MRWFLFFRRFLVLALSAPYFCTYAQSISLDEKTTPRLIRVAVQSNLPADFYIDLFAPTMYHLRALFPQIRFESRQMTLSELQKSVREKTIDLFFSDSGFYAFAQRDSGAMQIAAELSPLARNPALASGMAVIVRKNSNVQRLEDLTDKKLAGDDPENATTWLAFLSMAKKHGMDGKLLEAMATFTGDEIPGPVELLSIGMTDAAVVSTCTLERLEDAGIVARGSLRVLNGNTHPDSACLFTGKLFPATILAATTNIDPAFLKVLTISTLTMTPTYKGNAWSLVNDFSQVDSVYRDLAMGPYAYLTQTNWQVLWTKNKWLFVALIVGLLFWGFHTVRSNALIKRRTKELVRAQKVLEVSREHMYRMEKTGIVSGLCSMLVHEVRQPLATLVTYASSLKMYLKVQEIEDALIKKSAQNILNEAHRIDDIVEHVRGYAKNQRRERRATQVNQILNNVGENVKTLAHDRSVTVICPKGVSETVWILVEPLEIELALVNLIKNGMQAAMSASGPDKPATVVLNVDVRPTEVEFVVCDNGYEMQEKDLQALKQTNQSTKPDGLGLGLMIVRLIAENHGASLGFAPAPNVGLQVSLKLPRMIDKEIEKC